jgi:hypothetical protein
MKAEGEDTKIALGANNLTKQQDSSENAGENRHLEVGDEIKTALAASNLSK